MTFAAGNIMIIDDEESMRIACAQTLAAEGYRTREAPGGEQGLALCAREAFDTVLLDLRMPGMPGMEVLKKIKELYPATPVVVITGYGTIDVAVEAMKLGAADFIAKPFTPETLTSTIERIVNTRRLSLRRTCVNLALDEKMAGETIIGRSEAMQKVILLIKKVAPMDSTVLITGETGCGKELVARTVHALSKRHARQFVTVDCGALVETLFESEMFGHTRGSFTGATETTMGKFEMADNGTLFLDEIANIGINVQARLLRVIQEKEITKIGSSRSVKIDVRVISATNKNLLNEIKEGRFREDLFYRLNVVRIHVPPLRDRIEDIPLLAGYFMKKLCTEKKKAIPALSDETLRLMKKYDWPGNVRELRNALERAIVMSDTNAVTIDDILSDGQHEKDTNQNAPLHTAGHLEEKEREQIIAALERFSGHKSNTADFLGINRKTLREKIRKYRIEP